MSHLEVVVAKPEWLEESISDVRRSLRIIAEGRMPDPLVGFMIRTSAMRLLRCLYGSDLETAAAIRDFVMRDEMMKAEMDRKLSAR